MGKRIRDKANPPLPLPRGDFGILGFVFFIMLLLFPYSNPLPGGVGVGLILQAEPIYKEHRYSFEEYYEWYIPFKKAVDGNNEESVRRYYDELVQERPDAFFIGYATVEMAQFYLKNGNNAVCKKLAQEQLDSNVVIKEKALKLLIQEALLRRDQKETMDLYGSLLSQCPDADINGDIWRQIRETYTTGSLSINDTLHTYKDRLGYLRNLVRKEYYLRAKEWGIKLLQESPSLKDRSEVEFLIGFSNYKLFDVPAAAYFLSESLKHAPKSPLFNESRFYLARAYEESGEIEKAIKAYTECIKKKKENDYAARSYYHLTLLYKTYGKFDKFLKTQKEFSMLFILSPELAKYNWDTQWEDSARNKQMDTTLFRNLFANPEEADDVLNYYKKNYSKTDLSKAMQIRPCTYDIIDLLSLKNKWEEPQENPVIDRYERLKEYKLSEMVIDEIKTRNLSKKIRSSEDSEALLYIFLDKGNYYEAVEEAKGSLYVAKQNRLPITKLMIRALYPKAYSGYVEKYAKKYKIEPELLFAIMREESQFFKTYEAQHKKMGLCPMSIDTAKEIAWRMGENWTGENVLQDPETNIKFSAFYLADLLKQFKGNVHIAVLAFHTTPFNAGRVLSKGASRSLYDCEKAIPYSDARDIVTRVNDSYMAYCLLY